MTRIRQYFGRLTDRLRTNNATCVSVLKVYFDAHDFIMQSRIKRYLLVSGLIFLTLFSVGLNFMIDGIDYAQEPLTNWIISHGKDYTFDTSYVETGMETLFWLITFAIDSNRDSIFLSLFFIIGVPYLSHIIAKTFELLSFESAPGTFFQGFFRGLKISFYMTLQQFAWIAVISLFSLIPVVGIISPLLTFMVQAYFSGIMIADYSLERKGLGYKESKAYYKANRVAMLAIGLGMLFLLLIPVIGWFMAPTYAAVVSAIYIHSNWAEIQEKHGKGEKALSESA